MVTDGLDRRRREVLSRFAGVRHAKLVCRPDEVGGREQGACDPRCGFEGDLGDGEW
jgi:hypothetical protein